MGALTAGGGLYAAQRYGLFAPQPAVAAVLAMVAMGASLVPDMDTASKARPYIYGCLLVADAVLIALGRLAEAALLGMGAMLPAIGPHRGWTHAWWAALVVPSPVLAVWMVAPDIAGLAPWVDAGFVLSAYAAAVLGYASHLLADRLF